MYYVIDKCGSGQVDEGPFETRDEALACVARLSLSAFNVLDEAEMDDFEAALAGKD